MVSFFSSLLRCKDLEAADCSALSQPLVFIPCSLDVFSSNCSPALLHGKRESPRVSLGGIPHGCGMT